MVIIYSAKIVITIVVMNDFGTSPIRHLIIVDHAVISLWGICSYSKNPQYNTHTLCSTPPLYSYNNVITWSHNQVIKHTKLF